MPSKLATPSPHYRSVAGWQRAVGRMPAGRSATAPTPKILDRLAAADAPRRGDLDGRGQLTLAGLGDFCRFFLATCIDQARYMGDLLRTDEMARRIAAYVQLRAAGALPGPPLKPASAPVPQAVFLRGALARGEAAALTGYGERAGRAVLAALLAEGLLVCDSAKGAVRLGLPMAAVPNLLPGVFPAEG